jgi:hypothetical protein
MNATTALCWPGNPASLGRSSNGPKKAQTACRQKKEKIEGSVEAENQSTKDT